MPLLPRGNVRFLSSKVARRILLLFVVCALVPLTALAIVSFGQVNDQLYEHGQQRLEAGVRAVGQGIIERLRLAEAEIRFPQVAVPAAGPGPNVDSQDPLAADRFLAVTRMTGDLLEPVYGELVEMPRIGDLGQQHMDAGGTFLVTAGSDGLAPTIYLIRSEMSDGNPLTFIGSVNPRYLWAGGADTLPRNNHMCVFDGDSEPLFCTQPAVPDLPANVLAEVASANSGTFDWELDGEDYLASHWTVPLAYQFAVPRWTVMLSESKADLLAPMASFRRVFPLVILLSMWVVLLLSIGQIRRSLVPLERLREGTRRLADRQFDSRVDVQSGDEFEELADSFNDMAERLGKQFSALSTIAEIDRTVLSSLDIGKIVRTALEHTSDLIPCHAVSITLVSPDQQRVPRTYTLRSGDGHRPWVETTFFEPRDLRRFEDSPEILELEADEGAPAYVGPLARSGCGRFVVLPMFIHDEPSGAISLGFTDRVSYDEDDLMQARQLADQVAVALANAHLVEDLDALNWGALTALARTVDAKSPWTAGHSERVTAMGVKIGEAMQLPKEELEVLQRGGLLHDIGKIGVPAAILDKPGRLTEEEYAVMKRHPEIGANILQPIAAYADVLPIVRQHHERWDGSGYPDGLSGRQIELHARVCAVADVYDALISDRPYRPGMEVSEVIRIITAGDGTEFDPEVIAAFAEVMRQQVGGDDDEGLADRESGTDGASGPDQMVSAQTASP